MLYHIISDKLSTVVLAISFVGIARLSAIVIEGFHCMHISNTFVIAYKIASTFFI